MYTQVGGSFLYYLGYKVNDLYGGAIGIAYGSDDLNKVGRFVNGQWLWKQF